MDEHAAERLFRHEVIKFLREAGLLDEKRIELLLSWQHTGFTARGEMHIGPTDRKALETVARVPAHVPDPRRHLVFYFGVHSNAARGKRKKAEVGLQPAGKAEAPEELTPAQAARRRSPGAVDQAGVLKPWLRRYNTQGRSEVRA